MRYEELSIPLAGGLFQIRFHQHVTVLAGLTGSDRVALIDAFSQAAAGQVPGGTLVFRDRGGRRVVVRDGQLNYLDDGSDEAPASLAVQTDARTMRNLLYVGAEELGLPRPLDDPSTLPLQTELLDAREDLARARTELTHITEQRTRRDRALAELVRTDETLASLGSPTDRYLHSRAHTLVELERVRSVLAAVDAPEAARRRDDRLLSATDGVQTLADDWAAAGATLDQLMVRFRDRDRLDSVTLAGLVDIPDSVPAALAHAITDYESTSARRTNLEADLERQQHATASTSPNDPRIMVLATLDQDTLWMTHRRALLATEALEAAVSEENRVNEIDPGLLDRAEAAHEAARAASMRAERMWLPGILSATILICLSVLLPAAGYLAFLSPGLFALAAVALVWCVLVPRAKAHAAERAASNLISETGTASIEEYRQRFTEDPNSSRWRRADLIVDDYESAMEEWRSLVGDMDLQEVGDAEDQVHEWASAHDPKRREARASSVRRSLDHARSDLETAARTLGVLLTPYGLDLDQLPVAIGASVHERIQQGRYARLQNELGEAEEAERKLKHRLEEFLTTIGFEDGSLEARIGAYGWTIDDARQRAQMRAEAPDRDELLATRDKLEAALQAPAPALDTQVEPQADASDEGKHITDLRARRDLLRRESVSFQLGDEAAVNRRITKLAAHVESLQAEISPDAGVLVARPVDHLVETLVRFRPSWPASVQDPLPALLDDPFGATPPQVRDQLLDALCEVAKATQVILLTDDEHVAEWARREAARGRVRLMEPSREAV